jgi:hypothetical protein
MKTKLLSGLIAGMLLGGAATASELLTYFASTPLASTGTPRTIQLPGFNPDFGTLTEVRLTYWGEVLQTGKVENTGALTPMNYTLSGTAGLSLSKAGGPVLFASPAGTFSFTQGGSISSPFDGSIDFGGASGLTYLAGDTDWSAPAAYLDPDLAAYLGSGLLNFTSLATSTGGLSITAGNGLGTLATKASATLQVDYTYTLIPEPSTYAAGLGLVVFAAAALRRRAALAA